MSNHYSKHQLGFKPAPQTKHKKIAINYQANRRQEAKLEYLYLLTYGATSKMLLLDQMLMRIHYILYISL